MFYFVHIIIKYTHGNMVSFGNYEQFLAIHQERISLFLLKININEF
uniref:Uncharacterized protein n=1 Tax=Meloidogyne enterolobii TaxID=390850 RepID=A0A6V7XD34_MELEN|nr:unnamed protein product [Meloidogyne enterolobii]